MKPFKRHLIEKETPAPNTTNSIGNPIASTSQGIRNFWRWFGKSACVDSQGRPLVIYRGQRKVAKPDRFIMRQGRATPSFTADADAASVYARQLDTKEYGAGSNVMPVYLSIKNPLDLRNWGEQITLDVVLEHLYEYQDMIYALFELDDLIYKTGAEFEIDAHDLEGMYRLRSFEEVADCMSEMLEGEDSAEFDDGDIIDLLAKCTIDTYLVADCEQFVAGLKEKGYDGVIFDDVFDAGSKHYEGDKELIFSDGEGGAMIETYRPFEQNQVKSIFNTGAYSSSDHLSESVSRDTLRDMRAFGLSAGDIKNGYVTLYHGGKVLPKKLNRGEIFFMTASKTEAKDYARMRKGEVFEIKVRPEDVSWNQGSYEVEFQDGGKIIDGVLIKGTRAIAAKVASTKGASSEYDPWVGSVDSRQIQSYKWATIGDKMPKTGWKLLDIIQHKSGHVQFLFNGDKWYDADTVLNYEFA